MHGPWMKGERAGSTFRLLGYGLHLGLDGRGDVRCRQVAGSRYTAVGVCDAGCGVYGQPCAAVLRGTRQGAGGVAVVLVMVVRDGDL